MFRGHSVTVVVPAYNEEQTIEGVVSDYLGVSCVDRVLVVDNNCQDKTAEIAQAAGAEVITESAPGYGSALRAGLDHCDRPAPKSRSSPRPMALSLGKICSNSCTT